MRDGHWFPPRPFARSLCLGQGFVMTWPAGIRRAAAAGKQALFGGVFAKQVFEIVRELRIVLGVQAADAGLDEIAATVSRSAGMGMAKTKRSKRVLLSLLVKPGIAPVW